MKNGISVHPRANTYVLASYVALVLVAPVKKLAGERGVRPR